MEQNDSLNDNEKPESISDDINDYSRTEQSINTTRQNIIDMAKEYANPEELESVCDRVTIQDQTGLSIPTNKYRLHCQKSKKEHSESSSTSSKRKRNNSEDSSSPDKVDAFTEFIRRRICSCCNESNELCLNQGLQPLDLSTTEHDINKPGCSGLNQHNRNRPKEHRPKEHRPNPEIDPYDMDEEFRQIIIRAQNNLPRPRQDFNVADLLKGDMHLTEVYSETTTDEIVSCNETFTSNENITSSESVTSSEEFNEFTNENSPPRTLNDNILNDIRSINETITSNEMMASNELRSSKEMGALNTRVTLNETGMSNLTLASNESVLNQSYENTSLDESPNMKKIKTVTRTLLPVKKMTDRFFESIPEKTEPYTSFGINHILKNNPFKIKTETVTSSSSTESNLVLPKRLIHPPNYDNGESFEGFNTRQYEDLMSIIGNKIDSPTDMHNYVRTIETVPGVTETERQNRLLNLDSASSSEELVAVIEDAENKSISDALRMILEESETIDLTNPVPKPTTSTPSEVIEIIDDTPVQNRLKPGVVEYINLDDSDDETEKKTAKSNVSVISINDSMTVPSTPVAKKKSKKSKSVFECPICLENLKHKQIMSTICGHIFCKKCAENLLKTTKTCPNCRKKLTQKSIHPIYLSF